MTINPIKVGDKISNAVHGQTVSGIVSSVVHSIVNNKDFVTVVTNLFTVAEDGDFITISHNNPTPGGNMNANVWVVGQ